MTEMVNCLVNHLLKKMNKNNLNIIKQFKEAFKYRKLAEQESLEIHDYMNNYV